VDRARDAGHRRRRSRGGAGGRGGRRGGRQQARRQTGHMFDLSHDRSC
jgi:hypothetical protein